MKIMEENLQKETPAMSEKTRANWPDCDVNVKDCLKENSTIFPGDHENTQNPINGRLKRKRKDIGIDLNEMPSDQRANKRKPRKYWPKILGEIKPSKGTKKKPPKNKKEKKVSKSEMHNNPQTPESSVPRRAKTERSSLEKSPEKIPSKAARGLNFDMENDVKDDDDKENKDISNALVMNLKEFNFEPRDFDLCPKIRRMASKGNKASIEVESLLKDIPERFKKSRMKRRKANVYPKFLEATAIARQILPSFKQFCAAIMDSNSFKCVLSMEPIAKSRKKRSIRPKSVPNAAESTILDAQNTGAHECLDATLSSGEYLESDPRTKTLELDNLDAALPFAIEKRIKKSVRESGSPNFLPILKPRKEMPKKTIANEVIGELKNLDAALPFAKNSVKVSRFASFSFSGKPNKINMESCDEGVLVDYLIERLEGLSIIDDCKELTRYEGKKKKNHPLDLKIVLQNEGKKQKNPFTGKVQLDEISIRTWKLLMGIDDGIGANEETKEEDEKYWKGERESFKRRIDTFIETMHLIQGNRRFSPWKGSVLDSVVGVFLTQNVSDLLSSTSFMTVAAQFPVMNDECGPSTQESTNVGGMKQSSASKIEQNVNYQFEQHEEENPIPTTENMASPREQGEPKKNQKTINWDEWRKFYSVPRETDPDATDSVDWDAVRRAPFQVLSDTIQGRGQNNLLARRIKRLLDDLYKNVGRLDLEWLRDVPPEKAKEFLLSIDGLGLKSVECVRLLTLRHHAFPVDTNVGRVAVRLGWVPLEPLPDHVQIHTLKKYPPMDKIQVYLWPRLCLLDPEKLYELHYQLITFGKVFCTKASPNCNACPMRADCLHFASAFASTRFQLPPPEEKQILRTKARSRVEQGSIRKMPAIEVPLGTSNPATQECEPIIEFPASPIHESKEIEDRDIEDLGCDSEDDEIPVLRLDTEQFKSKLLNILEKTKVTSEELNKSKELVSITPETLGAITPEAASIPMPNLKKFRKRRKIHEAYELPDDHDLLQEFPKRLEDDPGRYLFVPTDERIRNAVGDEQNDRIVFGTIMVPVQTTLKKNFALNGTYFQVNEVFADDESSTHQIGIRLDVLLPMRKRLLVCGTSTSLICKGLSVKQIQIIFVKGFVCNRALNKKTRRCAALSSDLCPPNLTYAKAKSDAKTNDEES